jgi:hydroxymethylpyrimidine/phosphomethylpyrimidine kinase
VTAAVKPARILIIAGSDSSGGAGIQAGIKTAASFGAYAMTAITAVTVQNTKGVEAIHAVPPEIVRGQIVAALSDIGADAIVVGMLFSAPIVRAVAETLASHGRGVPIVVDPVMVSTSGAVLLNSSAVAGHTSHAEPSRDAAPHWDTGDAPRRHAACGSPPA